MQDTTNEKIDTKRRENIAKIAGLATLTATMGLGGLNSMKAESSEAPNINAANTLANNAKSPFINEAYADSERMMLPKVPMKLQRDSVGIVVVNPQIDFLSPKGIGWNIYGASIKEHNTIENIGLLFRVAKALRLPIFVSYVVWNKQDLDIMPKTPMKNFIKGTGLALGKGSGLSANDIANSGADFIPDFRPFILDNKTILTTPRKDFGLNGSDLSAKLRTNGIKQVILCGMDANTHVDSHLRDLLADGFEVGVVRDGTAGAKLPEGDGYLAALINFRFLANEMFYTKEVLQRLQNM